MWRHWETRFRCHCLAVVPRAQILCSLCKCMEPMNCAKQVECFPKACVEKKGWLLQVHVGTFQNKLVPSTHRVPWHRNHSQFVHVLKIESEFQRCPVTWGLQRGKRETAGQRGTDHWSRVGLARNRNASNFIKSICSPFRVIFNSLSDETTAHTTCSLMLHETTPHSPYHSSSRFSYFLF